MREITKTQVQIFICILGISLVLNTFIFFDDEFELVFKKIRENKLSSIFSNNREKDLKIFCIILTQPANLIEKVYKLLFILLF